MTRARVRPVCSHLAARLRTFLWILICAALVFFMSRGTCLGEFDDVLMLTSMRCQSDAVGTDEQCDVVEAWFPDEQDLHDIF